MPSKTMSINTAAKAILPGNKVVKRDQILAQLGLKPGIAPEAWLAIVACGSNASALRPAEAKKLLKAGKLTAANFDPSILKNIQP